MGNTMRNTRRLRVYTRQRQLLVVLEALEHNVTNLDFPKAPESLFLWV